MTTLAPETLGTLMGDTAILSVLARELLPGDLILKGHCLRRLVRQHPWHEFNYANWDVSRHLDTDHGSGTMPLLGTWQFLDDGVARFVIFRPDDEGAP